MSNYNFKYQILITDYRILITGHRIPITVHLHQLSQNT